MSDEKPLLKIGFPKGSLEDATIRLFERAGYRITKSSRSYRPSIDDPELDGRFIRAQEISRYVEKGFFDCGLTGQDWIRENNSDVVDVCGLVYSKASAVESRWVIAVPEDSQIRTIQDLEGKTIATELVQSTRRFLEERGVKADVEFSWGATEVKVPELVDAIVDITETGNSLRANKLRILETMFTTHTRFIANKASWENPAKRRKIENLALLLRAALEGEDKVGIKLNVNRSGLDKVLAALPALKNPTISPLANGDWVAVEAVVGEKVIRDLIPLLKENGAQGIVEYPLNKVVL
ncbi:MAG: ATP phosphoribosyltransferase [Verrucomicrobia bacterium ADurb.Bin474]|nr:MAG: ATP phosphoribosyltransferase [Verrucomicrobia bacterium ADurb.Bin474]